MDTVISVTSLASILMGYHTANRLLILEIAERKMLRLPTTTLEEKLQWNQGEARGIMRNAGII